jgi:hypothetical protein
MITKTETIIYLKRESLEIAKVRVGVGEKVTMKASVPWNEKSLLSILKGIPETFKTDEVRLLIDPEICYSMIFDWKEEKLPSRDDVQKLAEERVPEHLDNEWWDYKLLTTANEKKILFFAPVRDIYSQFIVAIKETVLKHEGTYPLEFLPKTENDLIAFSKISLTGKDKDTLVINPIMKEEETENTEFTTNDKKEKSKLPMLIGVLVLLIFILGIVVKVKFFSGDNNLSSPAPAPEAETTVTPVPTIEIISLAEYSLLILNSTKTPGLAATAEEILAAEGFEIIETGNATEEVELSTVAVKKETHTQVFNDIVRGLNSDFDIEEETIELEEENQYDVIITLSKRKETAQ